MNRWAALTALLAALLASSCGGNEPLAPPKPTKLVFVIQPSPVAETMLPLGIQPVVQAIDENGQAAPISTTVTVDVVDGDGSVAAGGAVATEPSGRAAFSDLTLGAADRRVGRMTLRFSAPGIEPVTAAVDLRCAVLPLAIIGHTVNRALTTGDCGMPDRYVNLYEITTSQAVTAVLLTQEATFGPGLYVRGPNEADWFWGFTTSAHSLSFKALLPPGQSRLLVTSVDPGRTGSYTLTAGMTSEDLTCESPATLAASPITTAQQLAPRDCSSSASLYEDRLLVGLPPSASITASMSSDAFQPFIKLADAVTNTTAAWATAEGTASMKFTNGDAPRFYYLLLTANTNPANGPYTLSVNVTYPPPGAAVTGAASQPIHQVVAQP